MGFLHFLFFRLVLERLHLMRHGTSFLQEPGNRLRDEVCIMHHATISMIE